MKFQNGYALYIVISLMLLSTLSITGIVMMVSSLDKNSGNNLHYLSAKQSVISGNNSFIAWVKNRPYEVASILNQLKYNKDNKIQKSIKVPIDTLQGNAYKQSNEIFLTDISNVDDYVLIKGFITGIGQNGSKNASMVLYKITGIQYDSLVKTPISSNNNTCIPDFALYLGGNQMANFTKSLYVDGGIYTNRLKQESYPIHVKGNFIIGSNLGSVNQITSVRVDDGITLIANKVGISGVNNFNGDVEILDRFNSSTTSGRMNISGNFRIGYWNDPTNSLSIYVNNNMYIMDGLIRNTAAPVKLFVGNDLLNNAFIDHLNYSVSEFDMTVNRMAYFTNSVKYSLNFSSQISVTSNNLLKSKYDIQKGFNHNLKCGNSNCNAIIENNVTIDTAPTYFKINGMTESNNYIKPIDYGIIDDSIQIKKKSFQDIIKLYNKEHGSKYTNSFDVSTLNAIANNRTFVKKYGFNDFLIIEYPSSNGNSYIRGSTIKINSKVAFIMNSGSVDYSTYCFPEVDPMGRVLMYFNRNVNAAKFNICDADGDGNRDFYGVIYYLPSSNGNNFFTSFTNRIYGSIYFAGGNDNIFTGGSGVDSIFLNTEVIKDISPIGFVKYDTNGNITTNCMDTKTSSDISYVTINRYYRPLFSTLQIENVTDHTIYSNYIDTTNYVNPLPYIELSYNIIDVHVDEYNSFDDIIEKFDIKATYIYNGYKNIGCKAGWLNNINSTIPKMDTNIVMNYEVKCGDVTNTSSFILRLHANSNDIIDNTTNKSSTKNSSNVNFYSEIGGILSSITNKSSSVNSSSNANTNTDNSYIKWITLPSSIIYNKNNILQWTGSNNLYNHRFTLLAINKPLCVMDTIERNLSYNEIIRYKPIYNGDYSFKLISNLDNGIYDILNFSINGGKNALTIDYVNTFSNKLFNVGNTTLNASNGKINEKYRIYPINNWNNMLLGIIASGDLDFKLILDGELIDNVNDVKKYVVDHTIGNCYHTLEIDLNSGRIRLNLSESGL